MKEKKTFFPSIYETSGGKSISMDIFSNSLVKRRETFLLGEVTEEVSASVCMQLMYLKQKSLEVRNKNPVKSFISSPGGSVSAGSASVCMQLMYLEQKSLEAKNKNPVKIFISSPGGSVSAGFAIYDMMKFVNLPVATIAVGAVSSIGAVLLACGTKGLRFALPHSKIMIHQTNTLTGKERVQAEDLRERLDSITKANILQQEVLAEMTGKSVEQIAETVKRDHYMTANEALDFGMVDKIAMNIDQLNKDILTFNS